MGDYAVPAAHPGGGQHHRRCTTAPTSIPTRTRSCPSGSSASSPGTYTWIPFGGGIRRCLGATLAMAEQRVVLEAIARRTDLLAPDPRPSAPRMRNVTMIPRGGCLVRLAHRYPD